MSTSYPVPAGSQDAVTAAHTAKIQVQDPPQRFDDLTDAELWEFIERAEGKAIIGLKSPGREKGVALGRVLVSQRERRDATNAVIRRGTVELLDETDRIPALLVRIKSEETLRALRKSPHVDYIEPDLPLFGPQSDPGCNNQDPWDDHGARTVSPGDLVTGPFVRMHVDDAWTESNGAGVTVGMIDTGVSQYQPQLMSEFDDGWSNGRQRLYISSTPNDPDYGEDWNDDCGHGTKVGGVIAAPRDGKNIVSVAWGANLMSVRAADDPAHLTSPGTAWDIRSAIELAADPNLGLASTVINMSVGSPFDWNLVAYEIQYWYHYHDVLFVGAAGTSGNASNGTVVFPARMPEVIAVTGIDADGTPCSACHFGPEVDFAAYVSASSTGMDTSPDIVRSSGSSTAAGIISGIAALIRSKYPDWTETQVYNRLVEASPRASKHDETGYGPPDACKATGCTHPLETHIMGPMQVDIGYTGRWNVYVFGGTASFTYQWQYKLECSNTLLHTSTADNEGGERFAVEPSALPCGQWIQGGSGTSFSHTQSTATTVDLKLTVTDSGNPVQTSTSYLTVTYGNASLP